MTLQRILKFITDQRENTSIILENYLEDLSPEEGVPVAQALAQCPNLTDLEFSYCNHGYIGAHIAEFAAALASSPDVFT